MKYFVQYLTMSEEDVVRRWQKFKDGKNIEWTQPYMYSSAYDLTIDSIWIIKTPNKSYSKFKCLKAMYVYDKKYAKRKKYNEQQNKYK